jgi:hypothetical protein
VGCRKVYQIREIMISIATFIQVLISICCTVTAGVILAMFQSNRKKQEKNHEERVTAEVCERELILSMASAIEVIIRKQNDEKLNGDVSKAMAELEEKKLALKHLTTTVYFEKTSS